MADEKLLGNDDAVFDDTSSGSAFYLYRYQAIATKTLKSMHIYGTGNCNVKVAIYADSTGEPGALLAAVNTSTAIVSGWNTINISNYSIVSGTYYWLAWNCSASSPGVGRHGLTDQERRYKTGQTFSSFSFPDPAGTGYTSSTDYYPGIAGWGSTLGGRACQVILI